MATDCIIMRRSVRQTITYYIWNRYNRNTVTTYRWNRYNVNSTTKYNWNRYNVETQSVHKWTRLQKERGDLHIDTNGTLAYYYPSGETPVFFINSITIEGSTHHYRSSRYSYDSNYNFSDLISLIYEINDLVNCDLSGTVVVEDINSIIYPRLPAHEITGNNTIFSLNYTTANAYFSVVFNTDTNGLETLSSNSLSSRYKTINGDGRDYIVIMAFIVEDSGGTEHGTIFLGEIPLNTISTQTITSTSIDDYPEKGSQGDYYYTYEGTEDQQVQGSASGTVTSTSSSAYPQDGIQGNYWYVYTGTTTEYSQGSANGSVTSTNRSQYPDNGRSGSYWYVYSTSTISYSQGSYIDQVTSTNRNQYPDNNYSGNYWYVYQGTSQDTITSQASLNSILSE